MQFIEIIFQNPLTVKFFENSQIPWLSLTFTTFSKFPWLKLKSPDFSLTWKKFHFPDFFPWLWQPCINIHEYVNKTL